MTQLTSSIADVEDDADKDETEMIVTGIPPTHSCEITNEVTEEEEVTFDSLLNILLVHSIDCSRDGCQYLAHSVWISTG